MFSAITLQNKYSRAKMQQKRKKQDQNAKLRNLEQSQDILVVTHGCKFLILNGIQSSLVDKVKIPLIAHND